VTALVAHPINFFTHRIGRRPIHNPQCRPRTHLSFPGPLSLANPLLRSPACFFLLLFFFFFLLIERLPRATTNPHLTGNDPLAVGMVRVFLSVTARIFSVSASLSRREIAHSELRPILGSRRPGWIAIANGVSSSAMRLVALGNSLPLYNATLARQICSTIISAISMTTPPAPLAKPFQIDRVAMLFRAVCLAASGTLRLPRQLRTSNTAHFSRGAVISAEQGRAAEEQGGFRRHGDGVRIFKAQLAAGEVRGTIAELVPLPVAGRCRPAKSHR